MKECTAIKCSHLYKRYPLYHSDSERLKSLILPKYKPIMFSALQDVTLEFKQGEIIGIIGLNGSGKSTLSRIIAGITSPTSGSVQTIGNINMLSTNIGMDDYLTGSENIRYKCLLMGLTDKQINMHIEEIINFADIGKYIDQPFRTYSSGMRSRLGFAISVSLTPDILIIDEALAVGDTAFAEKCLKKMNEFKTQKKTILFISHAVTQMKGFCDKIVWLHNGTVIAVDRPEKLIMPYCGFAREFNAMTVEERSNSQPDIALYQEKYL